MWRRILLVAVLAVAVEEGVEGGVPSPRETCRCSIFLQDELYIPKDLVMTMANDFEVDCTEFGKASADCRSYCADEMAALMSLYMKDPSILDGYPPSQALSCQVLPAGTLSFAKVCGTQTFALSSREIGPPVCCDPNTDLPIWCGLASEPANDFESDNLFQGRKLDLQKHQNDESHNEIEGSSSSSSSSTDSKPGKNKNKFVPPGAESWIQAALKVFGHTSITDLVKSIDIFSFPSKVQSAIRTYKDEVSMGRCYMEFTTFKVFTKQENPFEDLLRKKRDADQEIGPVTRFDEFVSYDYETDDLRSMSSEREKSSQSDAMKKVLGGLAGLLRSSESTKQYANMLTTFMPIISQLGSGIGGGSGSGSPITSLLKFVGPMLSQMAKPSRVEAVGNPEPTNKRPPHQPTQAASNPASSPLASMAMTMLGNVVSNFFNSPGAQNRIETPAPTTARPTQPSTQAPPNLDFASSGIMSLVKLFLQSASSPPAAARPIQTPKPVVQHVEKFSQNYESKERNFIDVLLELIRPVFISIIGNAPGDNGVEEIRKVSTLSTLGRVDDTLREEVDSPFFCFKKYMVNKAWSVTENGIRTVFSKFTPAEQARMMERMLA